MKIEKNTIIREIIQIKQKQRDTQRIEHNRLKWCRYDLRISDERLRLLAKSTCKLELDRYTKRGTGRE